METFWLLGRGDSTGAISQLSLRTIEQTAGIIDNMMVEMDPVIEETGDKNGGLIGKNAVNRNEDVNGRSIKRSSAETSNNENGTEKRSDDSLAFGYTDDRNEKSAVRQDVNGERDTIQRTTDSVSTSSSIDSKRYLQLEASNHKRINAFKSKNNVVKSATCTVF